MRPFHQVVLMSCLALVAACAPPPPFEFNPQTPDLKIAGKRPLNVAVVVPEPMSYSLFYQGQGGYQRDMTAEVRNNSFPLERDLSKITSDTFSQVFTQVVVLRDLPLPGQYDAVVSLSIGQILMQEKVVVTGETCDLTAAWTMSVLDNQSREVLSRTGISPSHNFAWSVMNPSRTMTIGINETLSLALTELAQEWGGILYKLELPSKKEPPARKGRKS